MNTMKCQKCKGEGDLPESIMDHTKNPPVESRIFPPCDACDGSGEVELKNEFTSEYGEPCFICGKEIKPNVKHKMVELCNPTQRININPFTGIISEKESQGGFAVGPTCYKKLKKLATPLGFIESSVYDFMRPDGYGGY